MNSVNIMGRIANELELRSSQNGKSVLTFSLATSSFKKDNQGNYISNFYKVVCFDKTADNLVKMCEKGKRICVNGYLDVNKYQDKQGNNRQEVQIIANTIDIIDFKEKQNQASQQDYYDDAPF